LLQRSTIPHPSGNREIAYLNCCNLQPFLNSSLIDRDFFLQSLQRNHNSCNNSDRFFFSRKYKEMWWLVSFSPESANLHIPIKRKPSRQEKLHKLYFNLKITFLNLWYVSLEWLLRAFFVRYVCRVMLARFVPRLMVIYLFDVRDKRFTVV
jgi:hypothetical protein